MATLSRIHIEDRQRPEAGAILQLIGDEVDAPCLIRSCRDETLFAVPHGLPLALWPDLAVSVTHSALCDLADPDPQLGPWLLMTQVIVALANKIARFAWKILIKPEEIDRWADA
jgi:hypothetical protein